MTYATIIKSAHSASLPRETVVIATPSGVRAFTRTNNGARGASNKWSVGSPANADLELVYGQPVSLALTATDLAELDSAPSHTGYPANMLQRLGRAIRTEVALTSTKLVDQLATVWHHAETDADSLGQYVKGQTVASVPTVSAPTVVASVVTAPNVPVASASVSQSVSGATPTATNALRIPQLTEPDLAGYIDREFGVKKRTGVQMLDHARNVKFNVRIEGHAGTGKTTFTRYYAGMRGLIHVAIPCNPQTDSLDVQGGWVRDASGGWRFQLSPFAEAIQQPSVILLNEANRMPSKAQNMFLQVLGERKLTLSTYDNSVIDVHPDTLIIADLNAGRQYVSTNALDPAFVDRFKIPMVFGYDRDIEEKLVKSKTLLDFAWNVRSQPQVYRDTPVSVRMLTAFEANAIGLQDVSIAIEMFANAFTNPIERDSIRTALEAEAFRIETDLGIA